MPYNSTNANFYLLQVVKVKIEDRRHLRCIPHPCTYVERRCDRTKSGAALVGRRTSTQKFRASPNSLI